MPNRILRDGILDSDRVDMLSTGGELFYRRLMSVVDDFGRFDGRASIIRAKCYPLRVGSISCEDIAGWVGECVNAGLLTQYEVDGKMYLSMVDFKQRIRLKDKSKYPDPPKCHADGCHLADTCHADARSRVDSASAFVDVDVVVQSQNLTSGEARALQLKQPPALEQVRAYAASFGKPELAQPYFDARQRDGWRTRKGAIWDYQADFRVFAGNWDRIQAERPQAAVRGSPRRSMAEHAEHSKRLLEEAGIGD